MAELCLAFFQEKDKPETFTLRFNVRCLSRSNTVDGRTPVRTAVQKPWTDDSYYQQTRVSTTVSKRRRSLSTVQTHANVRSSLLPPLCSKFALSSKPESQMLAGKWRSGDDPKPERPPPVYLQGPFFFPFFFFFSIFILFLNIYNSSYRFSRLVLFLLSLLSEVGGDLQFADQKGWT